MRGSELYNSYPDDGELIDYEDGRAWCIVGLPL